MKKDGLFWSVEIWDEKSKKQIFCSPRKRMEDSMASKPRSGGRIRRLSWHLCSIDPGFWVGVKCDTPYCCLSAFITLFISEISKKIYCLMKLRNLFVHPKTKSLKIRPQPPSRIIELCPVDSPRLTLYWNKTPLTFHRFPSTVFRNNCGNMSRFIG